MKNTLLVAFTFLNFISYSQSISLSRHDGTPITTNQVIAFNTAVFPASEMDFYVRNLSATASANVKIVCESLVNNDGTGFELCYGSECLSAVQEGDVFPTTGNVILPPNGVNGNFDHLLNTNSGSGIFPKDHVFRFYQVNSTGNEIGNSITMTYRYDPTLSVDEINQLQTSGVIIKSTLIDTQLELDVLKSTNMTIYDLNGKAMYSSKLNYGLEAIDVSNLSSGTYIVSFTNSDGITSTKKIIKK